MSFADADSGIDSPNCTASTAIGTGITAEGTPVLDAACADLAGNEATAQRTIRIDTVPLAVSLTGVTGGAVYGAGGVPLAECATVDVAGDVAGSGVATPAAPVTSGGPTSRHRRWWPTWSEHSG